MKLGSCMVTGTRRIVQVVVYVCCMGGCFRGNGRVWSGSSKGVGRSEKTEERVFHEGNIMVTTFKSLGSLLR